LFIKFQAISTTIGEVEEAEEAKELVKTRNAKNGLPLLY